MDKMIEQLCQEYTELTKEEIQIIQMMAQTLQPLANLEGADIFIDCPCKGGDAIVVAQARAEDVPSSYKTSVVGMLAKAGNEPAVSRTINLGIATKYMKARTQEDNYTIQSVEPIKYGTKVIGVLIRERRITEEGEEETEEETNDPYRAVEMPISHMINQNEWLTESIDEGLLLVDENGYVSFRNMYAHQLFQRLGYVKDILGQKYKNICLTPYDNIHWKAEMLTEVQVGNHALWIRQIRLDKDNINLAVIIQDITWRREQEKNLVLKSVAIKEVHHRVKNNLQTMASLLRLQARRSKNEETKHLLHESISRILSISATHQLLSISGMDEVNLKEVVQMVKQHAIQPFLQPNLKVHQELIGDDIPVDSDVAASAALAVNEILQNCMKYAFQGREEGTIRVTLKKGTVYSTLTVEDDGVGFDTKTTRRDSLGLNLVESMVRDKLHGTLKIRSDARGTKVSFDFVHDASYMITAR